MKDSHINISTKPNGYTSEIFHIQHSNGGHFQKTLTESEAKRVALFVVELWRERDAKNKMKTSAFPSHYQPVLRN